jgi:hypothetical protein
MFLEIPAILWDEETDDDIETVLDINPIHVIAIEPISRKACYVVMTSEIYYYVPLSKKKLNLLISEFVKQNILSKLYKDIKDQEGLN